jgi:hypothetical protein
MLLGYSSPVTKASTGVFTTATINTSLAFLKNGRPGALCELEIVGGANQLFMSFDQGIQCRLIALLNVTFDVGAPVTATLRIGDGGFGTTPAVSQVVETASGDRCVFWKIDADDVTGVSFILPEGTHRIGEVWASKALDACIRSDWSSGVGDIRKDVSLSGAVYRAPAVPRRTVSVALAPKRYEDGFESFRAVQLAVQDDPRVLIVPDAIDQEAIDRTAMYARVTANNPVTGSSVGRAFSWSLSAEEMPGRVPD